MNDLFRRCKEGDILLNFDNYRKLYRNKEIKGIRSFVEIKDDTVYLKTIKEDLREIGTVDTYNIGYNGWIRINKEPKDFFDLKLGVKTGRYTLESEEGFFDNDCFDPEEF